MVVQGEMSGQQGYVTRASPRVEWAQGLAGEVEGVEVHSWPKDPSVPSCWSSCVQGEGEQLEAHTWTDSFRVFEEWVGRKRTSVGPLCPWSWTCFVQSLWWGSWGAEVGLEPLVPLEEEVQVSRRFHY